MVSVLIIYLTGLSVKRQESIKRKVCVVAHVHVYFNLSSIEVGHPICSEQQKMLGASLLSEN